MSDFNLFEGYISERDCAAAIGTSEKTIQRYRRQPDGLPFTVIAKKIWINVDDWRAFLERRKQIPNPTRSSARRRRSSG